MTTTNFDAPVLVAGGGLVGLSAAMFLAHHGVRSLAIERRRNVLQLPRDAFFHIPAISHWQAGALDESQEHTRHNAKPPHKRHSTV